MLEHVESSRIKVGVLDFGDGRSFLQESLGPINRQFRESLVDWLRETGFEVVEGDEVIWQNELAVRNGKRMSAAGVDVVLFNFSVWAWPQYSRVAAQFCPQPIVMFSNVNPKYPGLVGMLANSGSLDQAGIRFTKSFGDISDPQVQARLRSQIVGIAAARRLKGLTYCLVGGRSLGIDTTVIDPAPAVARQVKRVLGQRGLLADRQRPGRVTLLTSGDHGSFADVSRRHLGESYQVGAVTWQDGDNLSLA